jgi:hypothetical protein
MDLTKDVSENMGQSELLSIIGGNAFKGLASSALLVAGFVKGLEFINIAGVAGIVYLLVFFGIFLGIYYKYFFNNPEMTNKKKMIWRDFFYTDKVDSDSNLMMLLTSYVGAIGVEIVIAVAAFIIKYLWDNSDSEITMSVVRITIMGIIATAFFIYTQRNHLGKEEFWGSIKKCLMYGFGLSTSMYALGIVVGISIMVIGLPLTLAVVILQFAFTSLYTYIDLLEWSKKTHKVVVKDVPVVVETESST